MSCCSYKIGSILEIQDSIDEKYKFITIAKKVEDIYTHIKLVYSEETIILDYEYNEISIDDLDIGDTVVVFHSNIMTMSIPPQTSAYIIEKK